MDQTVLDWLLEEKNPEVRLRTLKEYKKCPDSDENIIACKKELLDGKVYERGIKKLKQTAAAFPRHTSIRRLLWMRTFTRR